MTEPKTNTDATHSDRVKYFMKYLPQTDDVIVIVLKGHLIVEEILNEILKSHCQNYASIYEANLSFYQKAHVAKALLSGFDEFVFPAIFLLNRLRNDLAHNLDSRKRDSLIESFIKESKSIFGELHNENITLPGKLRNSICHAISSLSMVGDLSLIWKD